ncbi:MAG: phosphatase PAP2 family protein [Actinomycetota bacterium]
MRTPSSDVYDPTTHVSDLSVNVREREIAAVITIQSLASSRGIQRGARTLSHLGEHAMTWIALGLVGAARFPAERGPWLRATATVVGAHGVSIVLKRLVRRHRPADPRIQVHVRTPGDWSFPSSHAASTTAAAVAYSGLLGRRYPLISIPVMMTSRVILGVHYPSDVLAGGLLGAAMGHWSSRSRSVHPS